VDDLAAAERDDEPDLIPLFEEPPDVANLELVVVVVGLRPELDLFDLDDRRVLLRLVGLLRLLVLELPVVHDAADGRHGLGRDLAEVEPSVFRHTQRLVRRHDAELAVVIRDDADLRHANATVDAVRVLGRRSLRWSRNGVFSVESSAALDGHSAARARSAGTPPLGGAPAFGRRR